MSLQDIIPGYGEAIAAERLRREAAFMLVTGDIAGFEVVPITVGHYFTLRLAQSPFVVPARKAMPTDLENFLWLLSPHYTPQGGPARRRHRKACRRFYPMPAPWIHLQWLMRDRQAANERRAQNFLNAAAAALAYVDNAITDGAGGAPPAHKAAYYSDAAFMCALFAREYGWTQAETLNLPLTRLWQYLNEIKLHHGSKNVYNPSEEVRQRWLEEANRK